MSGARNAMETIPWATGGGSGITFVRSNAANSTYPSTTTATFTLTTQPTAGHKCIFTFGLFAANGPTTISSVVDSNGNSISVDATGTAESNQVAFMCSSKPTTTFGTITVTFAATVGAGSTFDYNCDEFSGFTSGAVDKTGSSGSAYGTSSTATLSSATTNAGDFIATCIMSEAATGTITNPSGYTVLSDGLCYYLPGTTGTFSAEFSWVDDANVSQIIVAYLP